MKSGGMFEKLITSSFAFMPSIYLKGGWGKSSIYFQVLSSSDITNKQIGR